MPILKAKIGVFESIAVTKIVIQSDEKQKSVNKFYYIYLRSVFMCLNVVYD